MKLFLAVWLGTVIGSAAWAAPLDGTTWKVKATPDTESAENGEKLFEDELVFVDGNVTATTRVSHGFKQSVYLVTEDDEVLKWQTVQHSDTEGVANWTGQVTEGTMTGKLICTKRNGTRIVYALAGTRTKGPPAKSADTPKTDDRTR